ncbi:MAG: TetR/AcrR family transcriptional regulator [Lachnospiraceae bacterium]|nr:TetR/AcrR family transcriptional regulator [Lachnospiraceae bacterium]
MTNEIQDERYHVADEAIHDAFFLILKEKELDKISVSDIIKRAGIVRSTFYNHYENIPALVASIEDKTIDDIFSLMNTFHPRNDWDACKSYYLTICEYTMTNPLLANLLRNPKEDVFFEKAVTMFHRYVRQVTQNTAPSHRSKEERSYMIACTIGSSIGVLHKWAKDNFQVPPETIADILTQAFVSGMLSGILEGE